MNVNTADASTGATALCELAVNTRYKYLYLLSVKTEENHIVAKYATVDSSVNRLGSRLLEVGTIESLHSLLSAFSSSNFQRIGLLFVQEGKRHATYQDICG